jgi:hypothetical protein
LKNINEIDKYTITPSFLKQKENRIWWCLLFNAKLAIFQLYHGESKLDGDVRFVLDQHTYLNFYSAS